MVLTCTKEPSGMLLVYGMEFNLRLYLPPVLVAQLSPSIIALTSVKGVLPSFTTMIFMI